MRKKRMFLTIGIIAAMLVFGVLLVGCKKQSYGEKIVRYGLSGDPETLDPQKTARTLAFQVMKSIYDTLIEPDEKGVLVAGLAESWKVSPDLLEWTFYIRRGVLFHNGDKLTALDVKATFDRIKRKETASPKASEYESISDIEVPDDYTVIFKLSAPASSLPATLASAWSAVLPGGLIDEGHDFNSLPVGTGPFMFKEWVRDGRVYLEKNPNYWMKNLPGIDAVEFNIIPEESVKLQGLLTGQLDIVDMINPDNRDRVRSNPDLKMQERFSSIVMVVAMNNDNETLRNVKVRQALTMAVDKQTVMDVAYGGGAVVATFMDYTNAYYKNFTHLFPYNPEKAKALLEETGYDWNTELNLVLPQSYAPHVKAGQVIQEMLSKVGVKTKIQIMESWYDEAYKGGKYDLFVIGHTGKLDPDGRLSGYGTDKNYVNWINPKAAELIAQAKQTAGFNERKKLYDKILEIMANEVPHIYIGTSSDFVPMRKNINGFRITNTLDTLDFRWVTME